MKKYKTERYFFKFLILISNFRTLLLSTDRIIAWRSRHQFYFTCCDYYYAIIRKILIHYYFLLSPVKNEKEKPLRHAIIARHLRKINKLLSIIIFSPLIREWENDVIKYTSFIIINSTRAYYSWFSCNFRVFNDLDARLVHDVTIDDSPTSSQGSDGEVGRSCDVVTGDSEDEEVVVIHRHDNQSGHTTPDDCEELDHHCSIIADSDFRLVTS